jgi:hypothetical protein
VSHPSLGRPPRDLTLGHPADAHALASADARMAARTLEAAIGDDPTFRDRYDELGLRRLLADLAALVERLATAVAANDPGHMATWAEMVSVRFRKRGVPMDDLIALFEALRRTAPSVVTPEAMASVDAALDAAIEVFRSNRRIAGDARKRNPLAALLYKGA